MVTSTVLPIAASTGSVVLSGSAYWTLRMYGFGVRYWRLHNRDARRAHRDAAYVRRHWRPILRDLRLVLKTTRTTRNASAQQSVAQLKYPKLKRIRSDDYGIIAKVELVPRVKLGDFQDKAEDLANYWRMIRVTATQLEPNVLEVRAVRRDPLLVKTLAVFPDMPKTLRYYPAGVDDFGMPVNLRLHSSSGIGVFGMPRFGKTSFILGLITYFAPSDSVAFLIADGKSTGGCDADYMDVAPRAHSVIGNDPLVFNQWAKQIEMVRRMRAATMRQARGVRNFWDAGPSPEWPLIMPIIDECHNFFDIIPAGGNPDMTFRNGIAAENAHLVANIVRMGPSAGILPVLTTQKSTSDGIPTMIRDNLHSKICYAVATDEAVHAALGKMINRFPEANPINFQHEDYIGVATMMMPDRPGYMRVRTPFCRDQVAAAVCERTAHLVRPSALPGLTVGQFHLALPEGDVASLTDYINLDKDQE